MSLSLFRLLSPRVIVGGMLSRVGIIAFNTYREAVRARLLHGLFGLALATGAYSLVVGALTLGNGMRVISDLGAASASVYGVVVAVMLMATSLHRELELKTIFPILARPIRRHEYLAGKYLGALLVLVAFVGANTGALLLAVAQAGGRPAWQPISGAAVPTGLALVLAFWRRRWSTWLPVPWAAALFVTGVWLAGVAPDERAVLARSALLTMSEVAIISAAALVFAAFTSPFLTAVFTFSVFVVGRSADSLAQLPERVFGAAIRATGEFLARVVPNLMIYVPPRPLLTGEQVEPPFGEYAWLAVTQAMAWSVALLVLASLIFRKRDFQ